MREGPLRWAFPFFIDAGKRGGVLPPENVTPFARILPSIGPQFTKVYLIKCGFGASSEFGKQQSDPRAGQSGIDVQTRVQVTGIRAAGTGNAPRLSGPTMQGQTSPARRHAPASASQHLLVPSAEVSRLRLARLRRFCRCVPQGPDRHIVEIRMAKVGAVTNAGLAI